MAAVPNPLTLRNRQRMLNASPVKNLDKSAALEAVDFQPAKFSCGLAIVMRIAKTFSVALVIGFFVAGAGLFSTSFAQKKKSVAARAHSSRLTGAEIKQAGARLTEMGYGTGSNALIAFQKYEGREVN